MQYLIKCGVLWSKCRHFQCSTFLLSVLVGMSIVPESDGQQQHISMPENYLPKEYFLSDGRRDPRHLQIPQNPSSSSNFFNPSSPSSGQVQGQTNLEPIPSASNSISTTTYHFNPQNHQNFPQKNQNFAQNYGNQNQNQNHGISFIPSSALALESNNQFGVKILPKSQNTQNTPKGSIKRHRRRLMKLRRLPKSFRPPKEFIIYSLPEQSFWGHHNPIEDPLTSDLNGNINGNEAEIELEDDEDPEEDLNANSREISSKKDSNVDEADGPSGDQVEVRSGQEVGQGQPTLEKSSTVSLDEGNNLPLAQKKVLLGQCMKHCIDALL